MCGLIFATNLKTPTKPNFVMYTRTWCLNPGSGYLCINNCAILQTKKYQIHLVSLYMYNINLINTDFQFYTQSIEEKNISNTRTYLNVPHKCIYVFKRTVFKHKYKWVLNNIYSLVLSPTPLTFNSNKLVLIQRMYTYYIQCTCST